MGQEIQRLKRRTRTIEIPIKVLYLIPKKELLCVAVCVVHSKFAMFTPVDNSVPLSGKILVLVSLYYPIEIDKILIELNSLWFQQEISLSWRVISSLPVSNSAKLVSLTHLA